MTRVSRSRIYSVETLDELTKEEILNLIGEAGIVGMGGAGFPTK